MIEGNAILEALEDAIQNEGLEDDSFYRAFRQTVRIYTTSKSDSVFLFLETELSVGDQLMVVKNNYFIGS